MKGNFFSYLLLAVAFTPIGCVDYVSAPSFTENMEYLICAGFDDTKTLNDGLSTEWVAGDAINVFHAYAGSSAYVSDGKYTVDEVGLAKGLFSGRLAGNLDSGRYDWYAVYPYDGAVDAGSIEAFPVTLPSAAAQDGYDSMAHLCGEVCPLYGKLEGVSGEDMPAIVMNQLASVVRVNVTNATDEDVAVKTISFSAEEDIAGMFSVDVTGDVPVFTSKDDCVSRTVTLNVESDEMLASGSTSSFYMVVKPFFAAAGSELVLEVNGESREIVLSDDVEFSPGVIKTLKFTVGNVADKEQEPVTVTLEGRFLYSDLTNGKSLSKINETNGRIPLDREVSYQYILDRLGMTNKQFIDEYATREYDVKFYDAQGNPQYGKSDPSDPASSPYPAGIGWNSSWSYNDVIDVDPFYLIIYDAISPDTSGSVVFTFSSSIYPDVILKFKYEVYSYVNVCAWPAFNPDVALSEKVDGLAVIQVKGKKGSDGKWEMASELKEHFKNYLSDFESPANHGDLQFEISDKSKDKGAVITGTCWRDQEIALDTPLDGDNLDIVVEAYMLLVNGSRCSMEYLVRFVNPFEAVLEEVELKTLMASPDTADLLESLVVKDRDGKAVYEDGAVTEYGKDVYLFEDDDILPEFTCEPDASFGGNLALLPDGHTLEWYNSGTTLQRDKSTVYGVRVSVSDIAVVKSIGKVVVLSSENSK